MSAKRSPTPSKPDPTLAANPPSQFMSVREAADYLHVNEKKVYALAAEGKIPGTKITGKWLFPRDLVDQWLTQSSHGGVFTDRLLVCGAEDVLMTRLSTRLSAALDARGIVAHSATGTRLGLSLLAAGRCDVALVHWGRVEESALRHPALLRHFPEHGNWVLVRAFRREQGLMLRPGLTAEPASASEVLAKNRRIVMRTEGSGTGRFLDEALAEIGYDASTLQTVARAASAAEAVERLYDGEADVAPASRAAATAAGLDFVALGWEAVDLALGRALYFRTLVQRVIDALASDDIFLVAERLGGYDFLDTGKLVWAAQD